MNDKDKYVASANVAKIAVSRMISLINTNNDEETLELLEVLNPILYDLEYAISFALSTIFSKGSVNDDNSKNSLSE